MCEKRRPECQKLPDKLFLRGIVVAVLRYLSCVAWAKEHVGRETAAVELQIINDKRSMEKGKG
ncbi:MAG: hypothetical protein IJ112_06825 [Oscillospiraceae bacterium]|nr:hypothetical protein [Oscillospiraceae bacterium]